MKKIITLFLLVLPGFVWAQRNQLQGTASAHLDVSNIRPTVLNAGDMFWDLSDARFEVPRGSGKHTIFASALWLGGRDVQNNLYVATQTYRQVGQSGFWPGPVGINQNQAHSAKYNNIWKISKAEIEDHILNYALPGYQMPASIASWPGNGNVANGEAAQLAPYADLNNDGIYSPASGDYPLIKGDQALYLILNDNGNNKMPVSLPMSAEIHVMYYGFNTGANTAVYNTIFTDYRIVNRGLINLQDVYAGIWTDFDLGFWNDDHVGCDTLTNRYYVYNGDPDDEGPTGYGLMPPVQSVMFLNQPMSHFIYYDNTNHATNGNPSAINAAHYYNYLRGIWKDGKLVTNGEFGTNQANKPVRYMFPGNPITQQGWSERNRLDSPIPQINAPSDRRGIGSVGPFGLAAGQEINFTVAFTYSRGTNYLNSIAVAAQDAQTVQSFFTGLIAKAPENQTVKSFTLAPNPAGSRVLVQLPAEFKNSETTGSVIDNLGREVLTFKTDKAATKEIELNINSLRNGVYQVVLRSGQKMASAKLVKL